MLVKQPIGGAVHSTPLLQSYSHGVVTEKALHCSHQGEVNHGVVLVGYGQVSEKDEVARGHCTEYWIVRSSWSAHWGEEGFFRLCIDDELPSGTCKINQWVTYPIL